ncbi:VOC family protein [Nocardioides sp.]|uniref:VOC family protein n=1 Tax=Nocardioides sp. TaxID=35761 RepID=UPI0039E6D96A
MTPTPLPRSLNHVAYVTRDTAATRAFYTEVLGLKLVGYAREEAVGSTGEPMAFLHTFFSLGDGSCIAFFEIEGVDIDHHESALPRWAPHLALSLPSRAELVTAKERLEAAGVEVVGIVEHEGIWSSIYFFDPNGVRLELTFQNRALNDDDAAAADRAVDQWLQEKLAVAS